MVSSAYLRLLIFLPAILIPVCVSKKVKQDQSLECSKWGENWAGTRPWRPKKGIQELTEMIQQESEIVVIILTTVCSGQAGMQELRWGESYEAAEVVQIGSGGGLD